MFVNYYWLLLKVVKLMYCISEDVKMREHQDHFRDALKALDASEVSYFL